MKRQVLYVTRNGLCEPLGQSQVFAYMKGLSESFSITVISFERNDDFHNDATMASMRERCGQSGIRWLPRCFPAKPSVFSHARSLLALLFTCVRECRSASVDLIHARSYLSAAIALIVYKLVGTPFIFDMRALWPEERIAAGRIKRDSVLHRAIVRIERECLRQSAGVVSLTEAAVDYLHVRYRDELMTQRIVVIPTCADLDRFRPAEAPEGRLVFSCVGTVLSGWFLLDWLRSFFAAAAERHADATFEIVTRSDADKTRLAVDPDRVLGPRLRIYGLSTEEVPDAVRAHSASAMFFTEGLSKLGSSPTRLGEILGTGLPVVVNAGVGDVANIVSDNQVGVVVRANTPEAMAGALVELEELRRSPDIAARCRQTAEKIFSLETGTERYKALYESILQ